ncbi:MAG: hypothetical protein MRERV_1c088 [Mycoplasmataceae bacterium RV_VA103A]|nr:MAG: hypothetical protein MRERV_10c024 [Mycoplasmataceae bacterium RV_VA103A]KLL05406.1 MAG: hypothetical protein MRERV_1c088 [Mycoplasmataceae bacterium RV_VA103A]
MPKFCQKCDKEIEEGKEVRIEKWIKHLVDYDLQGKYRTVTYTTPIERAIYYVCPDCFKKIEQELAEEKRKRERMDWIVVGLCVVGGIALIVALAVVCGNGKNRK